MFISCSEDSSTENFDNVGKLTLSITDAPFPYDLVAEANVTVFKVEARKIIADDISDDSDSTMEDEVDEGSPFVLLMESEIEVNLLDLTNGTTAMLADIEVPVGTYDLVRVYMKGINVLLTDGRTFDFKVPSGEQTGIKVFIQPGLTITGGLSSDLLLDFDVSRSFVAKGNTKKVDGITGFNFKPVIKASNLSTSGTLTGNVSSIEEDMQVAIEGAQISVFVSDTLNTTAFSDIEGNYTIMGLKAGNYQIFTEKENYLSGDTLNVEIVPANKTIQDFLLELETTTSTDN